MDRRNKQRVKTSISIHYRPEEADQELFHTAKARDLSLGSICFESRELLEMGSRHCIKLELPELESPLAGLGEVARIEESGQDGRYFYVMTFLEPTQEFNEVLCSYIDRIDIDVLFRKALDREASDIHLVAGRAPVFRLNGELVTPNLPVLSEQDLETMLFGMLTEAQVRRFRENLELDFSYPIAEGGRCRANIHFEQGKIGAAMRIVSSEIRSIAELGLPQDVRRLAKKRRGLILVTGPAGSGKSTTLASIINVINKTRSCMIVSIEDPIEYIHENKKSIVKQREVGVDTLSFGNALKSVLRQDPDVILVGEIRDLESVSMAISAAETGHLVLATLHTSDAIGCLSRIFDMFPPEHQNQICGQIAACLQGVVAQVLLPRKDGKGRALATEVLMNTSAVKSLLQTNKVEQILGYLETGAKHGMHTMDSSLKELVRQDVVDERLARGFAKDPDSFMLSPAR